MKNVPKSRQQNIVVQEVAGEVLIYDLSANKALCLNQASALVWEACDGERSIPEIAKIVGGKLKTEIKEDFVWLALEKLKKENLIVNPEEIAPNFNGLSRREVIRRIGFSSMVALPLVTSVVAPSAVHAQSGNTCSGACQCGGLLAPVSVCPPGFAECAQGCDCVVAPGGCFNSGDGVIACNGTCMSAVPAPPTCPPASVCQCQGDGNAGVSSCSAALGACPGNCTTCVSPIGNCFKPGGEGAFVCPGICS